MSTNWSSVGKSARRKGSTYERKVCALLSEWCGVKFKRSPRSGALLREGKINGAYIGGDLMSERDFAFSIECKNRKNINFYSALYSPQTSELIKSWHQCVYDASICEKHPLMFFHMAQKDFVVLDNNGLNLVKSTASEAATTLTINNLGDSITFNIDKHDVSLKLPNLCILSDYQAKYLKWSVAFK